MGLDMYLEKEVFIGGYFEHKKALGIVSIVTGGKQLDIPVKKISTITLHMGYWRKANHIHKWFVDNVQAGVDECQRQYVSEDQLEELKAVCQEVLADHNKADELLPTTGGFFFGGTDYDDYYFGSLKKTIDVIDRCLNDEFDGSIFYQSSW